MDLFPRKVSLPSEREAVTNISVRPKRKHAQLHPTTSLTDNLDVEDLPDQLEKLSRDTVTLLDCLNEFPEFADETSAIVAFINDLKVCLLY
jgi:WD repeat-containing protein 26